MLQTVERTNNIDVDLAWEYCSSAMMMLCIHNYRKKEQTYPRKFTTLVLLYREMSKKFNQSLSLELM